MAESTNSPIKEDLEFQRLEWRIERASWVVMAAVVIAAALGLLGAEGPFDHSQSGSSDSLLQADYQRFPHAGGPTGIDFQIAPAAVSGGKANLSIDAGFLSGYDVEQVTPDPDSVTAERDHLVYTFDVGTGPSQVSFDLQANSPGKHSGTASTSKGGQVHITQFVYP